MAGTPPLSEDPGGGLADARGRAGRADAPLRQVGGRGPSVAGQNEDRCRADIRAEEDVDRLVADHERRPEVEAELRCGPKAQPGGRLGARADAVVRAVGAGVDAVERGAAARELPDEAPVEILDLGFIEVTPAEAG